MAVSIIQREKTISKSYTNAKAYRAGNVVTVRIVEPASVTHTKGQWDTLFTLDPIFRPLMVHNYVLINNMTDVASGVPVLGRIMPNGDVMIWPFTDGSQVYGTMTYVVE